jgi:hypothetical protein
VWSARGLTAGTLFQGPPRSRWPFFAQRKEIAADWNVLYKDGTKINDHVNMQRLLVGGVALKTISDQFYAGRFSEIVAQYIEGSGSLNYSAADAVYIVGALSFLSRAVEAESILIRHRPAMTDSERFEATYYLVLNLRRQRVLASMAKARLLLIEMAKDLRRLGVADDRMQFFLCMGFGFYRYVDGRFAISLRWTQRAYEHAFRANFPFGRLVSYDMIGHNQLMVGQIRAGLKNLNSAAQIGESLGQGAIRQAVDVASRLYRSTYGLGLARDLMADLKSAIKACAFENSYTMANLHLELARLMILAGDGHLVEGTLAEASEWVYRLDIPFMDASLSFRYAHLAFLQGDHRKALEIVRTAKIRAQDGHSSSLMVGILGLELRLLHRLGMSVEAQSMESAIRDLGQRSGQMISRRINERLGLKPQSPLQRGEDLLGDLIDDIHLKAHDIRSRVLKSGFLGLVPEMAEVSLFGEALIFGFDGDSVTIVSRGQVRHDRDGWPELVRKLFFAFKDSRRLTKEEMTERVWRQNYSPLRHDPLIYALIARTRKTLEGCEDWLTVIDGTYRLRETVEIKDVSVLTRVTVPSTNEALLQTNSVLPDDLSYRQSKILEICATKGVISNKDICEAFQVSEVTAGRDLSDLVAKGYITRVGKGRATTYMKVQGKL